MDVVNAHASCAIQLTASAASVIHPVGKAHWMWDTNVLTTKAPSAVAEYSSPRRGSSSAMPSCRTLVTYTDDPAPAVEEAKSLFAGSPAAQHNRVIGIDDTAFQSVGVAIVDVIEDTARELFGG